jgi:hypothetical protein
MSCEQEKRIKMLEEEIMYLHKDMANLINIYENMHPEVHTHYTTIIYTKPCTDDQSESTDLNDFI